MLKKFSRSLKRLLLRTEEYDYPAQVVSISEQEYYIRSITADDIKDLLKVERDVYAGELPWTRSVFLSEIYSPIPHLYLCILSEDKMVGFIGSRVIGNDTHITNIAVASEFQEKGIGSFLIEEIEQFAVENRSETLSLEVRISNRDAQRMYRRLGFVSRAVKKKYYTDQEDALDMVKRLHD